MRSAPPSGPEAALRAAPRVDVVGLGKTYPGGVRALREVSCSFLPGTIHAVCGENGAGKSTLVRILNGLERADAGRVALDGRDVAFGSPLEAAACGLGMVHQHFSLLPSLTVTENVALGLEPRRGPFLDRDRARGTVVRLARRFGLAVDPDARVGALPLGAQQKVEILKALARDARVLILDEPTAVLTPPETDELFARLRAFRDEGRTIVLISHKLPEVRALAERVTVLRRGEVAGDGPLDGLDDAALARLIMGRERGPGLRRVGAPRGGAVALEVEALGTGAAGPADRLEGAGFVLRAGEILGVAGVDGSGQSGLVGCLSGKLAPATGRIRWRGRDVAGRPTAELRRRGLAHVPADRFREGGAAGLGLVANAVAGAHAGPGFRRGPFLRRAALRARARELVRRFDVRCRSIDQPLGTLSGGNAQKLIVGREVAGAPGLLLADQPTRGVDAGAARLIHAELLRLREEGAAVLLVTADLDELLALADRVLVLHAGRLVADLPNGPDLTPAALGPLMLGLEATRA